MKYLELSARKIKETTGLYKGLYRTEFYQHGILFATIPAAHKQPRTGKKTIVLNCFTWGLSWQ